MLFFLADGQLGNQIFQYCFLKTIQKNNEKIIVSGFEELQEVFELNNEFINLNKKYKPVKILLYRICNPILNLFSDIGLISSVFVNYEKILEKYRREAATYDTRKGLIKSIRFVKLGFFQSEFFFDSRIANDLIIKDEYLKKADWILQNIEKEKHRIFVHIRRGDYKNFAVCGKSVLLPVSYFKKQIDWFLQNKKNVFFIFLSDDPEYVEKKFQYIQDKFISYNNHFGVDLAIMTKCNSAILSPSSFGWWGSYLMEVRDTVFAPRYWMGFESKIEYQKKSTPSFAGKINI